MPPAAMAAPTPAGAPTSGRAITVSDSDGASTRRVISSTCCSVWSPGIEIAARAAAASAPVLG